MRYEKQKHNIKNKKKKLMKKFFTLFSMLVFSLIALSAEVTYNFTSMKLPAGWTGTAGFGYESAEPARGTQWTSNATLTLAGAKNVSKVVITCSSNVAAKNSIAVTVGGSNWGTETLAKESNVEKTFSGNETSGDIVINITRGDKSVWIKQIVVYGDVEGGNTGGGGEGDDKGDTSKLDPDYNYAEPTVIINTSTTDASNTPYSFIQNNIKVDCTTGAQRTVSDTNPNAYFGVNAGQSITFTATKPIVGLVINGMVKKDFDAEADFGEVMYVDASEEDVENDPVMAILDINSKSVTINCVKQMRCYSVEFYFEENPEIGGDYDYNFDWEPDETKNFNITFDEMNYIDFGELWGIDYISCYFISEDYELEMGVNSKFDADTCLPVGTYQINDTYEEGTVEASAGGNDYEDSPTYLATDFIEDDGEWYYNPYYIVSGTLKVEKDVKGVKMTLDAKTAKGSTVKATFVGKPVGYGNEDAINSVKTDVKVNGKFMKDGRITIRKDGKTYGTMGIRMK